MKLNYTSLQHAIDPVEAPEPRSARPPTARPVARAAASRPPRAERLGRGRARPGIRLGYVQTAGGALPGELSRDVRELRERGLLAGHVTAGAAYGGEHEAITTLGALDAAARSLGWDAIVCGPGPGILGSATLLRPRRDGGARQRARGARARPADAAVSAAVGIRRRAAATAASAITRRPCSSLLLGGPRPGAGDPARRVAHGGGRRRRSTCRASSMP